MSDKLVIGGSGFIGSHVSNHLAEKNQNVKVLNRGSRPEYLSPDIDYIESDVVNISSSDLEDVDTVFLQSGRTGIGDSLVEPDRYYQDNLRSVIPLLKMLDQSSVEHIVVASTIMVYGPGRYNCDRCGTVFPGKRSEDMLEKGHWEPVCSCGDKLEPRGSQEEDPLNPLTPYSRSKLLLEMYARDTVKETGLTVLRYPFVYGPRQQGAADYFVKNILSGCPPRLFEDGRQLRDFIYVKDIARINAMVADKRIEGLYNVGTGKYSELREFVELIASEAGTEIEPEINGEYRHYDVRHSIPDVSRLRSQSDFQTTSLSGGVEKTLDYIS